MNRTFFQTFIAFFNTNTMFAFFLFEKLLKIVLKIQKTEIKNKQNKKKV